MAKSQNETLQLRTGKYTQADKPEAGNAGSIQEELSWPRISIITPSFNQAAFLEDAIRSVLLQQYPNLEYLIIDGGSSDDSVDIIKKYQEYITYWVSEPDRGQADALNKGFRLATGEIIAWLNSDDYYEHNIFFRIAALYVQQGFDFLSGSSVMIDENGNTIQHLHTPVINYRSLLKYWKPHFCPPQPSLFFRRKIYQEIGPFHVGLQYAMDYDFWVRASRRYRFETIPDTLSYYRVHSASKTGCAEGFRKFIPEWKQVIRENIRQDSWWFQANYHWQETRNNLGKRIQTLPGAFHAKKKIQSLITKIYS